MMQAYNNSFDYPHHPYLSAPDDASNFANGFSRGSSSSFTYPHQDYHRYFVDRGELAASRLCTTSLVDNNNNNSSSLDATGIGFAGNPSSSNTFIVPEDISVYNQWDWSQTAHPIVAPAPPPVYPPPPPQPPQVFPSSSSVKSARNPSTSIVCSPTAQLPTPAAMAVLLNPNGRSTQIGDQQHQQQEQQESSSQMAADYEIPQGSAAAIISHHTVRPIRPVEPVVAVQGVPDSPSREKKHACTMCHKRFDRPSTLRKHLLVHTGEKAFVCDTCGRRFGVASNLNRHVKRCILKPVNSPSSSHKSSSGSPSANSPTSTSQPVPSISTPPPPHEKNANASVPRPGKRAHVPISPTTDSASPPSCSTTTPATTSASSTSTTTTASKPPGQKRRRRAPSPSQWIPGTLQNFNLHSEDSYRATTVPLPPVRRNLPREERNSWDENVNNAPYHPCGWSGTLPGPGLGQGTGLGGKDVRNNMNFGGRSGFMLGRVLVF
ncbi:hypothetical protein BYT27DRAFT_7203402 [Phlegmacium glaucopus]|nr:hypothetical protein BYT27DRAFT_7203402 [Phlegmacium glaucopus]